MITDPALHAMLDDAAREPVLLELDDREDIVALSETLFDQMMDNLEIDEETFAPKLVRRPEKQTIVLLDSSKYVKLESAAWEQILAMSQIGTLMSGLMPD